MNSKQLYEQDFFEWTVQNARMLRAQRLTDIDTEHLAEEIEDVGKREQREVRNRLKVLITHLLKWRVQPELRFTEAGKSGWLDTIREQRSQLELIFAQSPSLRRYAQDSLVAVYCKAIEDAEYETKLPRNMFPPECPFDLAQIVDPGFLPE
jgi:hypothetical protein